MKVTTGAMEGKTRQPLKRERFFMWWPQIVALSCSFLTDFSLVLCSARVTAGTTRRYLQPNQVAQAVQLLQDGTLTHAVTRRFAMSPSTVSGAWRRNQETSRYNRRAGAGLLLLCMRRKLTSTARFYKITSDRLLACTFLTKLKDRPHEGGIRPGIL